MAALDEDNAVPGVAAIYRCDQRQFIHQLQLSSTNSVADQIRNEGRQGSPEEDEATRVDW